MEADNLNKAMKLQVHAAADATGTTMLSFNIWDMSIVAAPASC